MILIKVNISYKLLSTAIEYNSSLRPMLKGRTINEERQDLPIKVLYKKTHMHTRIRHKKSWKQTDMPV